MTFICQRQRKFQSTSSALHRLVHLISWLPWARALELPFASPVKLGCSAEVKFFSLEEQQQQQQQKKFLPYREGYDMSDHARKVSRHCHGYKKIPRLPRDQGGWDQGRELHRRGLLWWPHNTLPLPFQILHSSVKERGQNTRVSK